MALTNVELYEALKGPVGEEAARMIAEVVPAAHDVATKRDLAELEGRIIERLGQLETRLGQLETRLGEQYGSLETRLREQYGSLESRINARLWMMFIPLWAGLYGLIGALLVRGG